MRQSPVRRLLRAVGERDPLLLAHHPSCEYYAHHTFELYGQQVCMGCFIVYPVGFVSLLALGLGRLLVPGAWLYALPTTVVHGAGIALLCPLVVAKAVPGRRSSRVRIVGKVLLAVGLAVVAFPGLFRPAARLATAGLFFGFLIPYVGYKAATATSDCAGCPEADEFPNCTGMEFDGAYVYSDDEPDP